MKLLFHYLLRHCHVKNEIIQIVACHNYDDFQHFSFIFSLKFIPLFYRLFNDEIDLR
jgi:hypothetical protein